MAKKVRKNVDFNQVAKSIVDLATGEDKDIKKENPSPKLKKAKGS